MDQLCKAKNSPQKNYQPMYPFSLMTILKTILASVLVCPRLGNVGGTVGPLLADPPKTPFCPSAFAQLLQMSSVLRPLHHSVNPYGRGGLDSNDAIPLVFVKQLSPKLFISEIGEMGFGKSVSGV